MCTRGHAHRLLLAVAIAATVGVPGPRSAANAQSAASVQIGNPAKEGWYTGLGLASGTASAEDWLNVDGVYCSLYYYSPGNYTYTYWNWVTHTWQTSNTWETARLASGKETWLVDSGFPTDWQPGRTYALNAFVYGEGHIMAADVNYFYIDLAPPAITLSILKPQLSPANNKMVLAAEASVSDDNDPAPGVSIGVSIADDRDPKKGGNGKPDWEIVRVGGKWQIWLRAKNPGPRSPRVYTITVSAVDAAGNAGRALGNVTVP